MFRALFDLFRRDRPPVQEPQGGAPAGTAGAGEERAGMLRALLADVKDDPYDERRRGVLADWLEDGRDAADAACAELLRSGCQAERMPTWDLRHGPLESRMAELTAQARAGGLLGPSLRLLDEERVRYE